MQKIKKAIEKIRPMLQGDGGDVQFFASGAAQQRRKILAGARVDTGNPQLPQVTLARAAVASCIPKALQHGLIGPAELEMAGSTLTLGKIQYFLVAQMA